MDAQLRSLPQHPQPGYHSVGTGIVDHAIEPFARAAATWTQDFALPIGSASPSNNWGPADDVC